MREIKFRAWDKEREEIVPVTQLFWDILGNLKTPDSFILMQYTGLKDKNGKEIYEGDICKFQFKRNQGQDISEVRFDAGEFKFCADGFFYSVGRCSVIEVIGNIYENPELVK